jgi:hypothetical protein
MSKNDNAARAANRQQRRPGAGWHRPKIPETVEAEEQRWTVPVLLRYPTGHEAELGQLAFDGKEFAPLTERTVMDERARGLAEDPAFQRAWDEQFGPAVPPRTS